VPEGHVVHADARRFTERMGGRVVHAASPQGRFADGAAALDGRRLGRAEAFGKNLFLRFAVSRGATGERAKPWLHVHLGLIGGWRWYDGNGAQTGGARLRGADGTNRRLVLTAGRGVDSRSVDLRGAMTCALLDDGGLDHVVERLGPDPLRDDADPAAALTKVRRSTAPLGTLLLRQDVVAGAGLIWRCEAPFHAGIAPQRPGRGVGEQEWGTLWDHLRRIMAAVRHDDFYLFRRGGEPCRVCSTTIRAEPMAGRPVWWCPTCQPG